MYAAGARTLFSNSNYKILDYALSGVIPRSQICRRNGIRVAIFRSVHLVREDKIDYDELLFYGKFRALGMRGRIRIDVLSKEIGFVQNDSSEFSQENDGSKTINANDNNRFSGAVAHAA